MKTKRTIYGYYLLIYDGYLHLLQSRMGVASLIFWLAYGKVFSLCLFSLYSLGERPTTLLKNFPKKDWLGNPRLMLIC